MGTVYARTGSRMVRAARKATTSRPTASGAVLGTVVEGDTPTLTVALDSGQVVPQCMGAELPLTTRVLCFWVNEGHDLVVVQLTSGPPPVEFDWAWTIPAGAEPSGRFLDTETGESWLDSGLFDPAPWYWAPTGLTRLVSDEPVEDGPTIGIGTVIPSDIGYTAMTVFYSAWDAFTKLSETFLFIGNAIIAVNNINGTASLAAITDLTFPAGETPSYTVLASNSGGDLGSHNVQVERTPAGDDDVYTASYGAASLEITLPRVDDGIVGLVAPWASQGAGTLSTVLFAMTAGGFLE